MISIGQEPYTDEPPCRRQIENGHSQCRGKGWESDRYAVSFASELSAACTGWTTKFGRRTWQKDMGHQIAKTVDDVANLKNPEQRGAEKIEIQRQDDAFRRKRDPRLDRIDQW